jgi:type II secretory pathway component PulL
VAGAAASLELARPARRSWWRQRLAPFAAGMLLAAMLGGGAAAVWHYREYATVLVQRVASRQ